MEIKKEIEINVPSFKVFSALTNQTELNQWFPDIVFIEPKWRYKHWHCA